MLGQQALEWLPVLSAALPHDAHVLEGESGAGGVFQQAMLPTPQPTCHAQLERPGKAKNSTAATMLIGIEAVQPDNNGWIGLGLSEAGGMHGARS